MRYESSNGAVGDIRWAARSSGKLGRLARLLLLAGDGVPNSEISEMAGVSRPTVLAWRGQFEKDGLTGFGEVAKGRGRKPSISEEKVAEIVDLTLHSKPEGETHWPCRSIAKRAGVSPASVQRIWSARGLKPHLVKTFKVSHDRHFEEKLIDVVGLYLNPPERAVVLCMDIAPDADGAGPVQALFDQWAQTGEELHAPALLPLEVMNALITGIRRGRWDGEAADGASGFVTTLPIVLHDDARDRALAWELSRRYDSYPIYDMLYVALAQRLGEPLVTMDDRLRRRVARRQLVLGPDEALKRGAPPDDED